MPEGNRIKGNGASLGFQPQLWAAADTLRGSMDAAESKPVLPGLVFLRSISDAFGEHPTQLESACAQGTDPERPRRGAPGPLRQRRPDVLVGDLLKTRRASQIFTVFGRPDVRVKPTDGTFVGELLGVDIDDPRSGEVHRTRGGDVAAWFLDTNSDGKTFKIAQAFFPGDPDAWEKLQRALKAEIDPQVLETIRGTVSFPFQPGEHPRIAVKVIDFRGNEVVRVMPTAETSCSFDRRKP